MKAHADLSAEHGPESRLWDNVLLCSSDWSWVRDLSALASWVLVCLVSSSRACARAEWDLKSKQGCQYHLIGRVLARHVARLHITPVMEGMLIVLASLQWKQKAKAILSNEVNMRLAWATLKVKTKQKTKMLMDDWFFFVLNVVLESVLVTNSMT